jgi:histidine triad (HIT) family protein
MQTHEPENYECPFCILISGKETEINKKSHIVYEDEKTLAYVAPKWWINNPGHVLVVPKAHTENLYTISDEQLSDVYKTVKKIAIAIKETYNPDGVSTRQHNEPAGNQDVWHLHVHVFPRYKDDNLYANHKEQRWVKSEEIIQYAQKLQEYFNK